MFVLQIITNDTGMLSVFMPHVTARKHYGKNKHKKRNIDQQANFKRGLNA
jgi:hypothetical protein